VVKLEIGRHFGNYFQLSLFWFEGKYDMGGIGLQGLSRLVNLTQRHAWFER
jgi:hypothetical protein